MRKIRPLVYCITLLLTSLSTAWAAGPVLTGSAQFPTEGQPGESQIFHVLYTNLSGDPGTVEMVVQTPGGGQAVVPGTTPEGTDPGQGISYTFVFTPKNTGVYKYHFHVQTSTSQSADWPSPDLQFTSYSIVTKYIILAIGIFVAMFVVPFIVYVVARSANKHGNPATAARFGLLVGIIASYGVFVYLFFTIYSLLTIGLGGIVAVALLITIFTRR